MYEAMRQKSRVYTAEGVRMIIYEGKLTDLVTRTCGLTTPFYTYTRRALMDMGCIRQLRRGGGGALSQWELITEPTPELWRAAEIRPAGTSMPPENPFADKVTALEQQVRDLNLRLSKLEAS